MSEENPYEDIESYAGAFRKAFKCAQEQSAENVGNFLGIEPISEEGGTVSLLHPDGTVQTVSGVKSLSVGNVEQVPFGPEIDVDAPFGSAPEKD